VLFGKLEGKRVRRAGFGFAGLENLVIQEFLPVRFDQFAKLLEVRRIRFQESSGVDQGVSATKIVKVQRRNDIIDGVIRSG